MSRLDVTSSDESGVEDLYPPDLENALGRTRQFVSFARAAGLLREDRGTVELTEIARLLGCRPGTVGSLLHRGLG